MDCRATFAIVCSLATLPLSAQTPTACISKSIPLKPAGLYCQNAAPVCITDSSGARGQWVWGCPNSSANQGVHVITQPPLPPIQYPHIDTPTEGRMKAEQLRNLQLQNQQIQQQLNTEAQPTAAPNSSNAISAFASGSQLKTAYGCGVLDGMVKAMDSAGNTQGADGVREALKQTSCDQIRQSLTDPPASSAHRAGTPLVNADIVDMVRDGVHDDMIVLAIKGNQAGYWLTPVDLRDLARAGVSDAVISAMQDKMGGRQPGR